jgi:hypothetical protein
MKNQKPMKKPIVIIAFTSIAAAIAFAQSPTPPPAAPAATPVAAATPAPNSTQALPHQTLITLVAGQIVAQMNNTATGLLQAVEGGVPAQPNGQAAIDGKELQAALGPEYVAWLRSVARGPAPTPAPEKK